MNVVTIGHSLDYIKRRIREGHERAAKGETEWVEGTIEVATALREGREMVPANVTFHGWLITNDLNFYSKDERAALIGLAQDINLARTVLIESKSHSYDLIWRENKHRFRGLPKNASNRKPRTSHPGRKQLHYQMKLGAEAIERIKGTTLDSADEKEELLRLNRGLPLGELTPAVRQLIDDAAAGKDVSAIAYTRKRRLPTLPPNVTHLSERALERRLLPAWRKRMVAAWQLATLSERIALVDHLMTTLTDEEQEHLVAHLLDNLRPTTPPAPASAPSTPTPTTPTPISGGNDGQ
jgi:hypothetical protein